MSKEARPVLDGQKIKWTLEQQRLTSPDLVRVDWLRFTIPVQQQRSDVDPSDPELNFMPYERPDLSWVPWLMSTMETDWDLYRGVMPDVLAREILAVDGQSYYATPRTLATLGALDFSSLVLDDHGLSVFPLVAASQESGMDYYAARCPIVFEGETVGWVLAGGKQQAQSNTIHFNLFGSACLRLKPADLARIADYVEKRGGWITRCDLALDCFEGMTMERVRDAYLGGEFDVRGKRPGQSEAGSWTSGHSRTFYVGARSNGKYCRWYEKGDELFGHEANSPWIRGEVEFRSNHRVIDLDVLRRPGDFFAAAYGFCQTVLEEQGAQGVNPQVIRNVRQLMDATVSAAARRVAVWLQNTAGPAIAAVWNLGGDFIAQVVEDSQHKRPKRLRGFSLAELQQAFIEVAAGGPLAVPA